IPQNGTITLKKDVIAILPFNLDLDGVRLRYATSQLMTRIETADIVTYIFFAPHGMSSEYAFDINTFRMLSVEKNWADGEGQTSFVRVEPGMESVITITPRTGKTIRLFTLTREQAERATKQHLWGQDRLIISDATAVVADGTCTLYSMDQP